MQNLLHAVCRLHSLFVSLNNSWSKYDFLLVFRMCVGVSVSRDQGDVTNSDQQPIYSSVHDTVDTQSHSKHPQRELSAAAAAAASCSLSKYVHETPI